MSLSRILAAIVLAALVSTTAGCHLMHELKPHRLSRWNQGPRLGRDTSNFSISDPTAEKHASATALREDAID